MARVRVECSEAGGLPLNYDVRVVAALALCVLALPPVVNAIMAQAAEQADTSWLRDQDFDGDPEIDDPPPFDFQPRPGTPPPEERPPPRDRDPPEAPECTFDPNARQVSLQEGVSSPRGSLPPLSLRRDDRGVAVFINGTQVTGRPLFELANGDEVVWDYRPPSALFGASVRQDHVEPDARAPETWTLRWDLSGVLYDSFELTLMSSRCEVPSDGR